VEASDNAGLGILAIESALAHVPFDRMLLIRLSPHF